MNENGRTLSQTEQKSEFLHGLTIVLSHLKQLISIVMFIYKYSANMLDWCHAMSQTKQKSDILWKQKKCT